MSYENNQNNEKRTPCLTTTKTTSFKSLRGFLFMSWILLGIAVVLHNIIG